VVLADGLLRNTSLRALQLRDNPVGWAGGGHLVHALARNASLASLGLQRCRLTHGVQAPPLWDRGSPGGGYALDLSRAAHRCVALELLTLREQLGAACWKGTQLDGKVCARSLLAAAGPVAGVESCQVCR
jgi:hypothetical protein